MPRPVELDDREVLAELYGDRSIQEVADLLGVSSTSVLRALRRHDIARRGRGDAARARISHPLLADRGWLADRYRTASIAAIAAEVGVDAATVRRAFAIHGLELHPKRLIPRPERPALLDDGDWLRRRYERAWTVTEIAVELDVNPQMVTAALVRHRIAVRSDRGSEHPKLADIAWLTSRVEEVGTAGVAAELGVSRVGVQAALKRHGSGSPHRFDCTRLNRPDVTRLFAVWEAEQTIKGVARTFEVSPNTAAIWLASVGVFVKDTPTISHRDLEQCVAEQLTIDEICERFHVTGRTVVVELHRHDLFERHRRRHLTNT